MGAVHFCSSCGKVHSPVPTDYFTFFGFPRKLNLDTAELEKEFYGLSRRLHPDVFGQADERERSWSLEQSSMLNDAYRTLKDAIKRTEYLSPSSKASSSKNNRSRPPKRLARRAN